MIGRIFGRWKVLEEDKNRKDYWLCECTNDGNRKIILGSNLRSGRSQSCGCFHAERSGETHCIDLTGKVFGYLKVIERTKDYRRKNGDITPQWLCECLKDGNKIVVQATNLKSGGTISCGCLKESFVASNLKTYFKKNYNAESEHKLFINPETNHWLRCDIFIESINVYIEVHGEQHYKFLEFFHKTKENFEKRKYLDKIKKKFMKKNGFYIEIDLRKQKTIEEWILYIETKINK